MPLRHFYLTLGYLTLVCIALKGDVHAVGAQVSRTAAMCKVERRESYRFLCSRLCALPKGLTPARDHVCTLWI